MDNPKISVIVPMYNRRHYIAQCLDSALNQTFREDYEIIVRDDGSTDGSADFVEQRYAKEISSGKIKLRRNKRNLGEFGNCNRLIREATGKYLMILHSDDMYLSNALEYMCSIAEHLKADVVHGCRYLNSPKDGIINEDTKLNVIWGSTSLINEVTIMPTDIFSRFLEWATDGTFLDSQYNIYNREFMISNELFFNLTGTLHLFLLRWLLNAKVYVKVPFIPYIRRDAPDSWSNNISKFSIEKFIDEKISLTRDLEKILPEMKIFADNKEIQRFIMLKLLVRSHQIQISGRKIYKDGISSELADRVADTFKKYFGDSSPYPEMLFNLIFMIPTDQNFERLMLNDGLRRIQNSITPPPQH